MLEAEEHTGQIVLQDAVPLVKQELGDGAVGLEDAGVVVRVVEPAVELLDPAHGALHLGRHRDVGLHELGSTPPMSRSCSPLSENVPAGQTLAHGRRLADQVTCRRCDVATDGSGDQADSETSWDTGFSARM